MQNHPHLRELFRLYQSETQSFRKVHRMIDLFESIIKTHTVLILAEYVAHNKMSKAAHGIQKERWGREFGERVKNLANGNQ